jgi:UDP-N-acetylmuramoyl-L-alanyl-D-glutamate--2,6-diaminopimelate ligase
MKLKHLLKNLENIEVKGSKHVDISGLSSNSKTIAPGNLFVAKKGFSSDGATYMDEAIASGATAVVTDVYNPFLQKDIAQLVTPNVQLLEGVLADRFYGMPSSHLFVVGVTGTSGKTTTTYMIRHMLEKLHIKCGLIGTVEWIVGDQVFPSTMTTPDVITNHKLLKEMLDCKCMAAVMEVSSHALTQSRVDKIDFDVAVFTNLSRDHLDYHKDMEEYAKAKALLFSSLQDPLKIAVINADSQYAEHMTASSRATLIRYGMSPSADLYASDVELSASGVCFNVTYKGIIYPFVSSLIGHFNVYNLLACMGVGIAKGFSLGDIIQALTTFSEVPGRLQKVPNAKGYHIFVDYSHKPDALENVLKTLQQFKKGRLICLFGCGGNRDAGKRPLMGKIAQMFSDEIFITTDNPRSEDPLQIIQDILQGIENRSKVLVEPDRREAIKKAISRLKKEDILLIAGKGHETYQIFSFGVEDFDDLLVAQQYCK